MKYGYVWWVIAGAQLLFFVFMSVLILIRRARRRGRIEEHAYNADDQSHIRKWARSPFWWQRMQAAQRLSETATADDRAMIRRLLLDSHSGVQSAATAILLKYADEELIASVIDTLATRSAAVRMYQSNVLRQHVALARPLVLQRLHTDAPPARLYSYIFLASMLGAADCMERVASLSIHPNPEVRVAVARALQGAPGHLGTIKLLTMLRDPDWRVRAQAARGLAAVGAATEERIIPELARALTDVTWWVRFRAGLALASSGERGRAALEQALTQPDRYAREMAAFVYAMSPLSIIELSEG